jgi:hypothetical protein
VNPDKSSSRQVAWGAWIAVAVGGLLFVLGAARFAIRHHFGFIDALYCCLAVVPAGLLLLVFNYVFHHARLVAILLLFMAGMLAFSSPVFDVALGVALMAAIAGPALREWKDEKRLRKSTTTSGIEKKEGE